MSKYCPMCDEITNCTENCKYCLEEEENKINTLTLNAWGTAHKISLRLAKYAENDNLYVGLVCHDDGYPEPWSDLTVNLSVKCADDCAFIDTNNNGKSILEWLVLNELATPTGRIRQSGFCVYPEMKFDMDELMKYTTKG